MNLGVLHKYVVKFLRHMLEVSSISWKEYLFLFKYIICLSLKCALKSVSSNQLTCPFENMVRQYFVMPFQTHAICSQVTHQTRRYEPWQDIPCAMTWCDMVWHDITLLYINLYYMKPFTNYIARLLSLAIPESRHNYPLLAETFLAGG